MITNIVIGTAILILAILDILHTAEIQRIKEEMILVKKVQICLDNEIKKLK